MIEKESEEYGNDSLFRPSRKMKGNSRLLLVDDGWDTDSLELFQGNRLRRALFFN